MNEEFEQYQCWAGVAFSRTPLENAAKWRSGERYSGLW